MALPTLSARSFAGLFANPSAQTAALAVALRFAFYLSSRVLFSQVEIVIWTG